MPATLTDSDQGGGNFKSYPVSDLYRAVVGAGFKSALIFVKETIFPVDPLCGGIHGNAAGFRLVKSI